MDIGLGSLNGRAFGRARERLRKIGRQCEDYELCDFDFMAKVFLPDAHAKWILLYEHHETEGLMFGFADLGLDVVELGFVHINDLNDLRGPLGAYAQYDFLFRRRESPEQLYEICQLYDRIIF